MRYIPTPACIRLLGRYWVIGLMAALAFDGANVLAAAMPAGTMRFDLPAQPLENALTAYSRITGWSVLVTSELTAGRRAMAVHDDLVPREALQRLLEGTDLEVRYIGETAFTLVPSLDAAASPSAEQTDHDETSHPLRDARYATDLQRALTGALCALQPDDFGRYRMGLQIWIEASGRIRDIRALESSGVPERDALIVRNLQGLQLGAPPADLPQPVTILLVPRPDPAADCRPFLEH